jgi:hypothetical protein
VSLNVFNTFLIANAKRTIMEFHYKCTSNDIDNWFSMAPLEVAIWVIEY